MEHTLYTKMKECALKYAQKDALVFYGARITYRALLEYVDKFATALREKGIKAGDTVTLCMPNSPAATISFYAINKIGAKVNLLHPFSTPYETEMSMKLTDSAMLIAYDIYLNKNRDRLPRGIIINSENDEFMPLLPKLVYRYKQRGKKRYKGGLKFRKLLKEAKPDTSEPYMFRDDEPAVFLQSGGTTGKSKIIMHNCKVFNELAGKATEFISEPPENYISMYSVLPIFHGFGLCMNMHMSILWGITNVMTLKFNPASMARAIEKEKVSLLTGVPAMFSRLLACKRFRKADLSSLKECFVGGDKAPEKLVDDFDAALAAGGSKAKLFVGYGLTETVTVCCVTNFAHNRRESVGYPLVGCTLAITDGQRLLAPRQEGEILIDTNIMMLGYLGADSPVRQIDGKNWLFTGDWGYIDEDGFLFFKQRIKNILKVNGVPVFPSDIEAVVEKIKGVKRVAVLGINDQRRGQTVKLFVEPDGSVPNETLIAAIKAECSDKLNVYSQPKEIELRELPTNAIGKVDMLKLSGR